MDVPSYVALQQGSQADIWHPPIRTTFPCLCAGVGYYQLSHAVQINLSMPYPCTYRTVRSNIWQISGSHASVQNRLCELT
jgi:hypothetical protein